MHQRYLVTKLSPEKSAKIYSQPLNFKLGFSTRRSDFLLFFGSIPFELFFLAILWTSSNENFHTILFFTR